MRESYSSVKDPSVSQARDMIEIQGKGHCGPVMALLSPAMQHEQKKASSLERDRRYIIITGNYGCGFPMACRQVER